MSFYFPLILNYHPLLTLTPGRFRTSKARPISVTRLWKGQDLLYYRRSEDLKGIFINQAKNRALFPFKYSPPCNCLTTSLFLTLKYLSVLLFSLGKQTGVEFLR